VFTTTLFFAKNQNQHYLRQNYRNKAIDVKMVLALKILSKKGFLA